MRQCGKKEKEPVLKSGRPGFKSCMSTHAGCISPQKHLEDKGLICTGEGNFLI